MRGLPELPCVTTHATLPPNASPHALSWLMTRALQVRMHACDCSWRLRRAARAARARLSQELQFGSLAKVCMVP